MDDHVLGINWGSEIQFFGLQYLYPLSFNAHSAISLNSILFPFFFTPLMKRQQAALEYIVFKQTWQFTVLHRFFQNLSCGCYYMLAYNDVMLCKLKSTSQVRASNFAQYYSSTGRICLRYP